METKVNYSIQMRERIEVNTDPQRRCYNGVLFSSELTWSYWELLEVRVSQEKIERRLEFWRELNDYAISRRGESARNEYRAIAANKELK